jgi:hypothetical protein
VVGNMLKRFFAFVEFFIHVARVAEDCGKKSGYLRILCLKCLKTESMFKKFNNLKTFFFSKLSHFSFYTEISPAYSRNIFSFQIKKEKV